MSDKKPRPYTLGIDLGGTKIAAGLCQGGNILKKVIFPTHPGRGFDAMIASIVDALRTASQDVKPEEIAGVGVGAAGQINPKTGAVIYAPNLGWSDAPLGEKLSAALAMPVKVTNDVRAATIAEWKYGAGKPHSTFVNVFLGTGIGSGMVLHGHLIEGATNSAGEIGHVCLDPDGPVCGCGKKGCFEAFASGRGLENHVRVMLESGEKSVVRDLVEGDLKKITGPIIGQAARQKDHLALQSLRRVGKYLGLAFANVHTLLNPEIILVGGGLMALKEFFWDEMKATLRKHVLPVADRGDALIGYAAFENDAVLLGASALPM